MLPIYLMTTKIAAKMTTGDLAACVVYYNDAARYTKQVAIMKTELESRKQRAECKSPLDVLRFHVTGAIERGEGEAITEKL